MMATAENPPGRSLRTEEPSLDSYVLLRVKCDDFQELRYEYRSEIYFHQPVGPSGTFEVVALKSIDVESMARRAAVEMPYNPAAPDQELIDKHGEEEAKVLMRKSFVDRWCRAIHNKRVQAIYLCCMAQHNPDDFQWIITYTATRAVAVESKEIPRDLTDFKLIGVRGPISDARIRSVLKEQKADQRGVLSPVRIEGDLYEIWVSNALIETFKSKFNVQMGFDPVFCAGVSEISVAQERLLKRIKGLDSEVQQLYLYHLKTTRPEVHQWIVERLWLPPEKATSKKTFFIRGIGAEPIEISLSSRRKLHNELIRAFEKKGIHGQAMRSLESRDYCLEDEDLRLLDVNSWVSISGGETLRLVLRRPIPLPPLVCERQTAGTWRPIVLLGGDSLVQYSERYSQGIGPYLRNAFANELEVLNRGLEGITSTEFLEDIPYMFRRLGTKVRLMILWLGSNDSRASDSDDPGGAHEAGQVPLDEFRENLASIIKHPLIVKGQTKVVLVTPPPLAMRFQNKTYGNGRSKRIRAAKRTQRYIAAVRDFADANNLALCDSEALLLQEAKVHAGGLPALYEDGLHLNEFGYHPISKALEDIIAS